MELPDGADGSITILGREIPIRTCMLKQKDLQFYSDNPRIYSIVHGGSDDLSQREIEERLRQGDYVKELATSIRANGGVIEPLIVRDGDYVVLEGNSRLAAYRQLAEGNPIEWGQVKCTLLPSNIPEECVFALLGEYHITKRKDWSPFEQAGYLWRRFKKHNASISQMTKEIGLSARVIGTFVKVYQFMVDHGDEDPQRWSYYYEYLKSGKVRKAREENLDLDRVIVARIKSGEIARAVEIRNRVVKVIAAGGKPLKQFLDKDMPVEQSYSTAETRGVNNSVLKTLTKFRMYVAKAGLDKAIDDMPSAQLDKCKFELKRINTFTLRLLKKCD